MKDSFTNQDGIRIVNRMIKVIQENKQYLSDIDGKIGDGDHGINMNKGFTLCEEKLQQDPGDLHHGLQTLSNILMTKIGGSMGPLYGMFFRAMAKTCANVESINDEVFGEMLSSVLNDLSKISDAKAGDKTLMDCLIPAEKAYRQAHSSDSPFREALNEMKKAAIEGRDSTEDMIAKKGRSSRLGERSKGVIDAGAASCCLILCTMADTIIELVDS